MPRHAESGTSASILRWSADRLGRHTETWENSATGPLPASWTFDTVRKGE